MIFLSNIKSYVPIKLCKTLGSIHLFKLMGSINRENITLHRNTIWRYNGNRLVNCYSNTKWKCS